MKKMLNKIKTAILIIFFGIFTSNICHAQAALLVFIFGDKVATENFHLSIDFGWNLSALPGLTQGKSNDGLTYGLGAFVKLNNKWAITPEFKALSPRGAKGVTGILPNDITLLNPETEFKFNYIDIPILIRFNISNSIYTGAGNTARKLGLVTRKMNDWKAVEELTSALREFDRADPVKYDFALFGLGVFERF